MSIRIIKRKRMKKFTSGIHVLIQKGNRYLLLRRSSHDTKDANRWDLPGGGIDTYEQPVKAGVREAFEEAGVKIWIDKILAVWATTHKGQWSIEIVALGRHLGGEVKLSHEHSAYKWVTWKELSRIKPKSVHINILLTKSLEKIGRPEK